MTAAICDGRAAVSGNRTVKVLPTPTWLVTAIVPPICSTTFLRNRETEAEAAALRGDEVVEDRSPAARPVCRSPNPPLR